MYLILSLWDMVERSWILDTSGFKTGTVAGERLATGGATFAGGASFGETGSCVTDGIEAVPCLAE